MPVFLIVFVEWVLAKIFAGRLIIASILLPFGIWISGLTSLLNQYIAAEVSKLDPTLSGLLGLAGFYDAIQIMLLIIPALVYVTAVKITIRLSSSTSGKLTA